MIAAFEGIAILMALWLVFGSGERTLEDRVALFQLISLFVLVAWIGRRLRKLAYVFGAIVDTLFRLAGNTAPRQSPLHRELQITDLCRKHYLALNGLAYTFVATGIAIMVVFVMHSLDEHIINLDTIWLWTYRVGRAILGASLVGMIGVFFHARPRCVAQSVQKERERQGNG